MNVNDYNFWQDFFDTYQSLSDWIKFAWLVVPPAFVLGLVRLLVRPRGEMKPAKDSLPNAPRILLDKPERPEQT